MKQLKNSILIFTAMSLMCGVLYPLLITGFAQLSFPWKSNGSIETVNGRIAGSELIAQGFSGPGYFHGRPSAIQYDGLSSGGSNLGPTNKKLIDQAAKRAEQIRRENNLPADAKIPAELVLSSGSGLDPHISLDSALLQVTRIARTRGMDPAALRNLVEQSSGKQYFGVYGYNIVNVLKLNLALDKPGTGI